MSEKDLRKVAELNKTEKKAIIVAALEKEGYTQSDISKMLEVSRQHIHAVHKKVRKGVLNHLATKAKRSVKSLLEGQPVGAMTKVTGQDVLTAAKMVLDRVEPLTVKNENTSVHMTVSISDDDRDRYKKALGIIDAEYQVLPVVEPKLIEGSSNGRTEGFGPSNEGSTPSPSSISRETEWQVQCVEFVEKKPESIDG